MPNSRSLNTGETEFGGEVRETMSARIVDQAPAVTYFVELLEKFKSRLYDPNKPIGCALFTGPSGTGKTFLTEVFAESVQPKALRDWRKNMMKVDCGEFQHSHEISKLIGSPPGYLGHRETKPMLAPERIRDLQGLNPISTAYANDDYPFAIILWDEIEKASDSLWNILLGIFDHGTLMLGNNESVDMRKTIHIMTSNIGFSEGKDGLGFNPCDLSTNAETVHRGIEAAKRKFSVEFINRLDGVIGFTALDRKAIARVLKLELGKLQFEIFAQCTPNVLFSVTGRAQRALLEEAYDPKYNARLVKRVIDKHLRLKLARIIGSKQILPSEGIHIDYVAGEYAFEAVATRALGFIIHGSKEDLAQGDKL